jgi:hypothetical protein
MVQKALSHLWASQDGHRVEFLWFTWNSQFLWEKPQPVPTDASQLSEWVRWHKKGKGDLSETIFFAILGWRLQLLQSSWFLMAFALCSLYYILCGKLPQHGYCFLACVSAEVGTKREELEWPQGRTFLCWNCCVHPCRSQYLAGQADTCCIFRVHVSLPRYCHHLVSQLWCQGERCQDGHLSPFVPTYSKCENKIRNIRTWRSHKLEALICITKYFWRISLDKKLFFGFVVAWFQDINYLSK